MLQAKERERSIPEKKTTLLWYILYIIEVNRMVEKCKIGKMNCNRHLRVAYETVCIMRKIIKYTVKLFSIFFIPKKKKEFRSNL